MPPRRDIYSSFSDPNSFLGQPFIPRVASAVASGAGNIARAEDQFRSDVASAAQRGIQGLGRLATTVGSALTFPIRAAQEAVSGAPLISGTALGRTQQAATPEPRVPAFPSGMTGNYSPVSQVAPTIPTTTVQQPQTQVASVNPRPATADDLNAFYGRGAYAPQPAAQVAQPTPQRTAIQTPYGTIYATAEQASNLSAAASRPVDQRSTRSPAEQQALLAQARTAGQKIASDYTKTMRDFTQGNIRTGFTSAAPRGRYGQPLTDLFPQSTEAIAQRNQRIAPVMATTGFSEMQREQASMTPPAIRNQSLFGGMGYASSLGGPQPASSMLAAGPMEQRPRRRIFGTV
jgi:hypothetical protein